MSLKGSWGSLEGGFGQEDMAHGRKRQLPSEVRTEQHGMSMN